MRSLLVLVALLLAGCASSPPHDGHDAAAGPNALLGLSNEGEAPLLVSWDLASAAGAMHAVGASVPAGETVEKLVALSTIGAWSVNLTLQGEDAPRYATSFDTAECGHGTFHLVLAIDGAAPPRVLTRECH